MTELLALGGYGLYVWGAYGIALVAIAIEVAVVLRRHRNARCAIRP